MKTCIRLAAVAGLAILGITVQLRVAGAVRAMSNASHPAS
jgi:hypothetical protein